MAMKLSAPPKPRAGTQRTRPRPQRVTPFSRGTTPIFRASTPSRQQTPSDAPSRRSKRPCANPDCENPNVKLTDDMSAWVCQTCGVLANETANLVSEPGFVEGQGGRITALGVTVGADQSHQRGAGRMQGTGNVGQEVTSNRRAAEDSAKSYMRGWLNILHCPQFEAEAGMRIFGLAWQMQFIKGRSLHDVAIVCLYLALRRATRQTHGNKVPKYPVMLIDFAEMGDVDVFSLGKIFKDLVGKIYPTDEKGGIIDPEKELIAHGPEILIPRFVESLDFPPESSNKIRDDAIKIVKRMNRDWLAEGRRPAGVCGAAVILAARMNNHRRSTREVMLTAKVTEITLNKRLEEFSDLPSSKLSVKDFRDDTLRESISEADPPAYTRARLGPQAKKKRGRSKKLAPETAAEIEGDEESNDEQDDAEPPAKRPRIDAEGFAIPDLPNRPSAGESSSTPEAETTRRSAGRPKGAKNWRAPPMSTAEQWIEEELQRDIDLALEQNTGLDLDETSAGAANKPQDLTIILDPPEAASQASAPQVTSSSASATAIERSYPLHPGPSRRDPPGPRVDTDVGNTGIISLSPTLSATEFDDDPDVANCLLSETERVLKERIWVTANEDWLRQDHAKRIKKELHEAEMREKGLDPDKFTKDGRKKLKGTQWRADGSRKAGKWGDVSYLKDPLDPDRRKHRAGSQAAEDEGGTPTAEELAERGEDGGTPERPSAGEAVAKMMYHRRHAFTSSSRRIDLDAVQRLYQLDNMDSSSQASDDPQSPASRRRSSTTPLGLRPNSEPQSILRKTKHTAAAFKREARKRDLAAQQARSQYTKSASPDAAGPSGNAPSSGLPPSENEEAEGSRSPSAIISSPPADNTHQPLTFSPTPRPPRPASQPHATTSQPHTPTSASTLSVLDDGSVEEVVGELAAPIFDDEGGDGEIQMRERSGDTDEDEDDANDYVDDDEDAEGEEDLEDAFAGAYQPRRTPGGEEDEDEG